MNPYEDAIRIAILSNLLRMMNDLDAVPIPQTTHGVLSQSLSKEQLSKSLGDAIGKTLMNPNGFTVSTLSQLIQGVIKREWKD